MTYRLAIHTQHTSTIALEQNGFLLEVVSEERFTGRKTDDTFPLKSIFYVIEKYKIKTFKQVIFCSNVFNIFKEFPRKRKKLLVNPPLFLEFCLAKFKDLLNLKSKSASFFTFSGSEYIRISCSFVSISSGKSKYICIFI